MPSKKSAIISTQLQRIPRPKDCLPCRLTGAATFSGIGTYAVYQGYKQGALAKIRPPGGARIGGQIQIAVGVVFIGLGLGRLVYEPSE